ncbi:hypothetical protein RF11_11967 [Thelohanellus kitauei]|uniref:Paired domain-containing protein n=1 Tax=Thelohanellus kitauei TaxID=669202 RepID=A0A0C2MG65_THEKT|nr:hypothetical protein RF11_11967 [Thelohanellus kitauei]
MNIPGFASKIGHHIFQYRSLCFSTSAVLHMPVSVFKIPPQKRRQVGQDIRNIKIRLVVNQGREQREVGRLLILPHSTINNIVERYEATNSTKPGRRGGAKRTVLADEIIEKMG